MSNKRKNPGFADSELLVVIAWLGILLAVMLPVVQGVRDGAHNGFNALELLGTILINIGTGVSVVVTFMFGLFLFCTLLVAVSVFVGNVRKRLRQIHRRR